MYPNNGVNNSKPLEVVNKPVGDRSVETGDSSSDEKQAKAMSFWFSMSSRLQSALPSVANDYYQHVSDKGLVSNILSDPVKAEGALLDFYNHSCSSDEMLLHRYIGAVLESLALLLIDGLHCTSDSSLSASNFQRSTVFEIPRLFNLTKFGLSHIHACHSSKSMSKGQKQREKLKLITVRTFLEHPTRVFVLLEMAYVLEVLAHHRDYSKTFPTSATATAGNTHKVEDGIFFKATHPLSEIVLLPPPLGTPVFPDLTSTFLCAMFYPLQEVLRSGSPELVLTSSVIERCLTLFCFGRVPIVPTLKNYIPEFVPMLLNILSDDNEFVGEAAHKILFTIFKFFNKEFDFGESYLQLATSTYTQVVNLLSSASKPWNDVWKPKQFDSSFGFFSSEEMAQTHRQQISKKTTVHEEAVPTTDVKDICDFRAMNIYWNQKLSSQVLPWSFTDDWDKALDFLQIPEGHPLKLARSSVNLIMEFPLMIMLLMQINSSLLRFHAPSLFERIVQFLNFTEPYQNYCKVHYELSKGRLPSSSIRLLDLDTHRSLLDSQVKTLAFVSYFIRGNVNPAPFTLGGGPSTAINAAASNSNDQSSNAGLIASLADLGSYVMELLKLAPYQMTQSWNARPCMIIGEPTLEPADILKKKHTFLNPDLESVRTVVCRREVLVALRSITGSQDFRCSPAVGNLQRSLDSRCYLGLGLGPTDYLKPFACQLRLELINHLRSSDPFQRHLLVDVSFTRSLRSDMYQVVVKDLSSVLERVGRIPMGERNSSLAKMCEGSSLQWKLLECSTPPSTTKEMPKINLMEQSGGVSSSPESVNAGGGDTPSSADVFNNVSADGYSTTWTYGELRALLLSKYNSNDAHRALLTPSDKLLPMSILARLTHLLCIDLHDSTLPIYNHTLSVRALLVITDWVDRLSLGIRIRTQPPAVTNIPPNGRYIDQKETADIFRRVLESCAAKLSSLRTGFSKYVDFNETESDKALYEPSIAASDHLMNNPDYFAFPRQATWANPPLSVANKHNLHRASTAEVLKEIRTLVRSLSQCLRSSAFLLTVVGVSVPADFSMKDPGDLMRLQNAPPLNDADYQTVRGAILDGLHLSILSAFSTASTVQVGGDWKGEFASRGIRGRVERLTQSDPCASAFSAPNVGTSASQQAAVKGLCNSASLELHMAQVQQDEKDLIESIASILPNLHSSNARSFFSKDLRFVLRLTEIDPSVFVFVHYLSQQSATSVVVLKVLVNILNPHLPLLIDQVALSSIRLPSCMGKGVISIQKTLLRKRIADDRLQTLEDPKRHCCEGRAFGRCVAKDGREPDCTNTNSISIHGQFLVQQRHNSSAYSRLSYFKEAPYFPLDLLEPSWSDHCPSISVIDPIDDDIIHSNPPLWDQNEGLVFRAANDDGSSHAAQSLGYSAGKDGLFSSRKQSVVDANDDFDGKRASIRRLGKKQMLASIANCPSSLSRQPCRHHHPTSFDDSSADQNKGKTEKYYQYFYMPKSHSMSDLSISTFNSSKESLLYRSDDSILISSSFRQKRYLAPSSLGASADSQLFKNCVLYDPSLVSSSQLSQPTPPPPLKSQRLNAWPLWCGDSCQRTSLLEQSEGLSSATDFGSKFALVEGFIPGISTLTHTATGVPRWTVAQTLLRMWKITFTLLCHYPEALPATSKYIEELVINIISMVCVSSRCYLLLNLLRSLLRQSNMVSATLSRAATAKGNNAQPLIAPTHMSLTGSPVPNFFRETKGTLEWAVSICSLLIRANHPLKRLLSDISLIMPVTASSFIPQIHLLLPAIDAALDSPDPELAALPFRLIEMCIEVSAGEPLLPGFSSPNQTGYVIGSRSPLLSKLFSFMQCPFTSSYPKGLLSSEVCQSVGVFNTTKNVCGGRSSVSRYNAISSFICRLLGKAGGKLRMYISEIPRLPINTHPSDDITIGFPLISKEFSDFKNQQHPIVSIPLIDCIQFATSIFDQHRSIHAQKALLLSSSVMNYVSFPISSIHGCKVVEIPAIPQSNKYQTPVFPFLYSYPYSYMFSLMRSDQPSTLNTFGECDNRTDGLPWTLLQHSSCCCSGVSDGTTDDEVEEDPIESAAAKQLWSFCDFDKSCNFLSKRLGEERTVTQSIEKINLQRWIKLIAFDLLSRTMVEMFGLDFPPDQAISQMNELRKETFKKKSELPDWKMIECPLTSYKSNPSAFKVLRLLMRGLLEACSDFEPVIRHQSQSFIFNLGDIITVLFLHIPGNQKTTHDAPKETPQSQQRLINPLELCWSIGSCIDLSSENWSMMNNGRRLLLQIAQLGIEFGGSNSLVFSTNFIRPVLHLCHSNEATVAAGGVFVLIEFLKLFPLWWICYHFVKICQAIFTAITCNHSILSSDLCPNQNQTNQTQLILMSLAEDALSLLLWKLLTDGKEADQFLSKNLFSISTIQLNNNSSIDWLWRFLLDFLLPCLFNENHLARQVAFNTIENLCSFLDIPLKFLLMHPIDPTVLEKYGCRQVSFAPDILGTTDPLNEPDQKEEEEVVNINFDLINGCLMDVTANQETLLGQILQKVSNKMNFKPGSPKLLPVLDVLCWLLRQNAPPISFNSSFLLRLAYVMQLVSAADRLSFPPLIDSEVDTSTLPLLQAESASLISIQTLRILKLICIHPSSSVTYPINTENKLLSLGDISNEVTTVNAQSLPNGYLAEVESSVRLFADQIGLELPQYIQGPLLFSLQLILKSICLTDTHVSNAAMHALLVVLANEANRKEMQRQAHLTQAKNEQILQTRSSDVSMTASNPIIENYSLFDLFEERLVASCLKNGFSVLTSTECRSVFHIQALITAVLFLSPKTNAVSAASTKLMEMTFTLCDGCDSLRQITQPNQNATKIGIFSSFSPSLHIADVPQIAAGLIMALTALPSLALATRHLPRTALRLIAGLVDFTDLGFAKPTPTQTLTLGQTTTSVPQSNTSVPMPHPLEGASALGTARTPAPTLWAYLYGGRGDWSEVLEEAVCSFCIAHAELVADVLFLPVENVAGTDPTLRQSMPGAFVRSRMAVVAFRAAKHARAYPFRQALMRRTDLMSRLMKDVTEIQFPWIYFDLTGCANAQVGGVAIGKDPSLEFSQNQHTSPDPVGWNYEGVPSVINDFVVLITILHAFEPRYIMNHWMEIASHCASQDFEAQQIAVTSKASFHLLPKWIDVNVPWQTNSRHPLLHSILDYWNLSHTTLVRRPRMAHLAEVIDKEDAYLAEMTSWTSTTGGTATSGVSTGESTHVKSAADLSLPPTYDQSEPDVGISHSLMTVIDPNGNLAFDGFHMLLHQPTARAMAMLLVAVLEGEFLHEGVSSPSLWVEDQKAILRVKLIFSLSFVVFASTSQDFDFIQIKLNELLQNPDMQVKKVQRDKKLVLQTFFRSFLYRPCIPDAFKLSVLKAIVIPLVIQATQSKDDNKILAASEWEVYFNEIMLLTPDPTYRQGDGQMEYLSDVEARNDAAVVRSVTEYFEMCFSRYPSNHKKNVSCSIRQFKDDEEFQVEMLRLLHYVSMLKDRSMEMTMPFLNRNSAGVPHHTTTAEHYRTGFIWNLCQSDSAIVRHQTFHYIATSLQSRECLHALGNSQPPDLFEFLQFFIILIQSPHIETKFLDMLSIDALVKSTIYHDFINLASDIIHPIFRQLVSLDGMTPYFPVLQLLCQLVVRHPNSFYKYRITIIPFCSVALTRVALNAGSETRRLILDLVMTLLYWELRQTLHDQCDIQSKKPFAWISKNAGLEVRLYYAMKAALTATTDIPMVSRALCTLTRCLLLCPTTCVRYPSILKCMQLPPSRKVNGRESSQQIATKRSTTTRLSMLTLTICDILLGLQKTSVFIDHLDLMLQTFDPLWGTTDMSVIVMLQSIVSKIVQILPPPNQVNLGQLANVQITTQLSVTDIFWVRISQVISAGLNSLALQSEQTWCLDTSKIGSQLPTSLSFMIIKQASSSDAGPGNHHEQRKLSNTILETLAKTTPSDNGKCCDNNGSAKILVDPHLSLRLLFALTLIDFNITPQQRSDALLSDPEGDEYHHNDRTCSSHSRSFMSRQMISVGFGSQILIAMSTLQKILIQCRPLCTRSNSGQVTWKLSNRHSLIPNSCDAPRGLSSTLYECRVQLYSELLQLASSLYLYGTPVKLTMTIADDKNMKSSFPLDPSTVIMGDEKTNGIEKDSTKSFNNNNQSQSGLWHRWSKDLSNIYIKTFLSDHMSPNSNLQFIQNFMLTVLLELPQKMNFLFGLMYDCLLILGRLMSGPEYDPFESFHFCHYYQKFEKTNCHRLKTSTPFRFKRVKRKGCRRKFEKSSPTPSSSFGTLDCLDQEIEEDEKLELLKLFRNSDLHQIQAMMSLNHWSDIWNLLSIYRAHHYVERSVEDILFSYYSPPDFQTFGYFQATQIIMNSYVQLLHEWSSVFFKNEIPELHLFYFDLIERVLTSRNLKICINEVPLGNSTPQCTKISDNVGALDIYQTMVSDQYGPVLASSAAQTPIASSVAVLSANLASQKVAIHLYNGYIGLWVPDIDDLLTILSWNNKDQVFEGRRRGWNLGYCHLLKWQQDFIKDKFTLINLLQVVIMGSLSSHPAVSEGFQTILDRAIPPDPLRRLFFFMKRPEFLQLRELSVTRLLTQMLLLTYSNKSALHLNSNPKFPDLSVMISQLSHPHSTDLLNVADSDKKLEMALKKYQNAVINEIELSNQLQKTKLESSILHRLHQIQFSEDADQISAQQSFPNPVERSVHSLLFDKWSNRLMSNVAIQNSKKSNSNTFLIPLKRLCGINDHISSVVLSQVLPSLYNEMTEAEKIVFSDSFVTLASSGRLSECDSPDSSSDSVHGELTLADHLLRVIISEFGFHNSAQLLSRQQRESLHPFTCGMRSLDHKPSHSTESILNNNGSETSMSSVCKLATKMVSIIPSNENIKALFGSLLKCHPPINFPPFILHYLATSYNCWYLSIQQLQHQSLCLSTTDKKLISEHAFTLSELFDRLGEPDLSTGVLALLSETAETKSTLMDASAGRWSASQDALNELFKKIVTETATDVIASQEVLASEGLATLKLPGSLTAKSMMEFGKEDQQNTIMASTLDGGESISSLVSHLGLSIASPDDIGNVKSISQNLRAELGIWAHNWIQASTQLNQWNSLNEISSCANVPLTLDSRAKLQDWQGVEQLVTTHDLVTPQATIGLFYASLSQLTQQLVASAQNRQWSSSGATPQLLAEENAATMRAAHGTIEMMEQLLVACQKEVVSEWRNLPSIVSSSHLRSLLFAQLQVETTEGFRWITEFIKKVMLGNGQPAPVQPIDSRPLVMSWRSRLLCVSDDMRAWSDLLVWRNCFFTVVQSLVATCPKLSAADQFTWGTYQQDVAWTILKFAHVANWPHRLPEVALALLSKLHTLSSFFTSPAYETDYLKTVTRCVKLCQTPAQMVAALNLLRSIDTNVAGAMTYQPVSLLEKSHSLNPVNKLKGSLFVAKARLLAELPPLTDTCPQTTPATTPHHLTSVIHNVLEGRYRDPEAPPVSSVIVWNSQAGMKATLTPLPFTGGCMNRPSNFQDALNELTAALDVCPTLSSAWSTWANFADRVFTSPSISTGSNNTKQPDISQGVSAILGYLMSAYLSPKTRPNHIGRALWLLVHDDDSRTLGRTFGKYSEILPSSVWFSWIPQLLSGLERLEGIQCFAVLARLLEDYPQSVFWDIRAAFMEKAGLLALTHELTQRRKESSNKDSSSNIDNELILTAEQSASDMSKQWNDITSEIPVSSPKTSRGSSTLASPSPPMYLLQGEMLLHQLFVGIMNSQSAPICLVMDYLADSISENCLPSRLEEITRNIRILLASLIETPLLLISNNNNEVAAVQSRTRGCSAANVLSETPMPPHLELFMINQIQCKFILLMKETINKEASSFTKYWMQVEKEIAINLWSDLASDFCWDADYQNDSIDRMVTPLSVEATLAIAKVWADKLDTILDHLAVNRADSLNDLFMTKVRPQMLSQKASRCYNDLIQESKGADPRPISTALLVPGAFLQLSFLSPLFSTARGTNFNDSDLCGFELTKMTISKDSVFPGNRSGRVSSNGLFSNTSLTRINFESANGVVTSFLVDPCGSLQLRSEQRFNLLLGHLNNVLVHDKEPRRRGVNFAIPVEVPMNASVRLISRSENSATLKSIWDTHSGLPDPDLPQLMYRRVLANRVGGWLAVRQDRHEKVKSKKDNNSATLLMADPFETNESRNSSLNISPNLTFGSPPVAFTSTSGIFQSTLKYGHTILQQVPRDVLGKAAKDLFADMSTIVPEDVLKCFIHNCFSNPEHQFISVKRMTIDLGAWSLLSHALLATDIHPSRLVFDVSSSRLTISSMKPTIRVDTLMIHDNNERVPFRLTRNLLALIGPLGKTSLLPASMYSILDCLALSKNEVAARTFISLSLRDDLWASNCYKSVGRILYGNGMTDAKLKGKFTNIDEKSPTDLGSKNDAPAESNEFSHVPPAPNDLSIESISGLSKLSRSYLSVFTTFSGMPPLLCAPDFDVIESQRALSWTRQAISPSIIKSIEELSDCILFIAAQCSANQSDVKAQIGNLQSSAPSDQQMNSQNCKTPVTGSLKKDKIKTQPLSGKWGGGLTIGQIRDKTERNAKKILDRLGHLYNVGSQKVDSATNASSGIEKAGARPDSPTATLSPSTTASSVATHSATRARVHELIESAVRTGNLATMPATWAPWL